ncbi:MULTISPECIES: O-antigen ligase family protein [Vibrio]|uniref:O-antigen ligase family protein n=1 Tax=Vibrio TaxID=662 RepID=UPI0020759A85|nr:MULTISPECIES: O-antigen ligase [Vibrio]USD34403.1 O-antigen ligase family protein [Vibrio sp. SCSIO 43186]USD47474.1 O-antigen ligase family protein [Vibrio sp. SCSIO 43145]USD71528.1 O-antigen ligase family protein [Vibrio sp. SCSIO 43139]USD98437.1 polymerase [Vibrio coralliilyticus]
MTRFLERLIYPAFLLFVFWLPVPLGGNRPWAWSINEFIIAGMLLLCVICYSSDHWRHSLKRTQSLLVPLTIFTVWAFAQPLFPFGSFEDTGLALVSSVKTLHYLQLCLVASVVITSMSRLKTLLIVMVSSGVCQGFYAGVIQLLDLPLSPMFDLPVGHRASGSFVYHNHLANFLLINLCIGFGLLIAQLQDSQKQSIRLSAQRFFAVFLSDKAFIRLGLIIMVIALVLTRSRMGNVAFFVALTTGSLLLLLLYKNKPKSMYVLIASLFMIDTVIVSTWFGLDKVKQRLVETSLSNESRDDVIYAALEAIQQQPWLGYGGGSFYSSFQAFNNGNIQLFYDHAHNDYVQFVFEYGLIGSSILALIVIASLRKSIVAFKQRRSRQMKGAGLGAFMAILGMLIHMSVDFPLQAPATTLYFLLCLLIAHWAVTIPAVKRKRPND